MPKKGPQRDAAKDTELSKTSLLSARLKWVWFF